MIAKLEMEGDENASRRLHIHFGGALYIGPGAAGPGPTRPVREALQRCTEMRNDAVKKITP